MSDSTDIDMDSPVFWGIIIAVGLVVALIGYRLFKPCVAILSFFFVGSLCYEAVVSWFSASETVAWIVFAVTGLIAAALVLCLLPVAAFLAGVVGGFALADFLCTAFLYKISPEDSDTILLVSALTLGLVCGLLALFLMKPVIILATSFAGSQAAVQGIGYFAGGYPTTSELQEIEQGDFDFPSTFWAYFAATIVLFLVTAYIQFRYTAYDIDHHKKKRPPPQQTYYGATTPPPRGNNGGINYV